MIIQGLWVSEVMGPHFSDFADDDEWTFPVGGGIGKIFRFGDMPVDMQISAYKNIEAADSAADWFAEFQVRFIFPK